MTKIWHRRVEQAALDVAEDCGFTPLEPLEVYFRLSDDRYVLYRPDALLIRKRRGYHVVVVEAETNPAAKVIPGDVGLAGLIRSGLCEMYPYDDLGIGRPIRANRTFRYTYDRRSTEMTFQADGRRLLDGTEIGTLGFLLVVPNVGAKAYFERYLHLLAGYRRGVAPPFSYYRCTAIDGTSRKSVRAAMRSILGNLYA